MGRSAARISIARVRGIILFPAVFLLALLLLTLAGCAPETDDTLTAEAVSGTYTEPGWMAETRQRQEKESLDMVACLSEAGWEARATPDSGWEPVRPLTEDLVRAYADASSECAHTLWGELPGRTEAEWRVKYAHALDTRDCLISRGYSVSEPPSEDYWVQAGLDGGPVWAPFEDVLVQVRNRVIDMDERTYYELFAACPQDGPVASMSGF